MSKITQTPGARMVYLIRRRTGTSREELLMHWFANHMPGVVESQLLRKADGKSHAWRYIASLFDTGPAGDGAWDGMAQLWWDRPLPTPKVPFGTTPRDTFQEKAEPYTGWATREHVVLDGSEHLPVEPLELNLPFPCTRSGLHKTTVLVKPREGVDLEAMHRHWLEVHAPYAAEVFARVGAYRYVVGLSVCPEKEAFAGMAEMYFHEPNGMQRYVEEAEPDGMDDFVDGAGTLVFETGTEMIGIP